jgi:hypothetical protein
MGVSEALERDLAEIRLVAPALADSSLAATAQALAAELDSPSNSATSKSMCAKVFSEVMGQLRALAPAKREKDDLDDLAARRAKRLGGATA